MTNSVTNLPNFSRPSGIAINPAGTLAYVTNSGNGKVQVIDTASNAFGALISVGGNPVGISFNSAGTRAYVVNSSSHTVSVIDTATATVIPPPINTGLWPIALGQFIKATPAPVKGSINLGHTSKAELVRH